MTIDFHTGLPDSIFEQAPKKCTCQVCQDIARWKAGLNNQATRAEVFSEMFGRIEEAETSVTYYQEILAGRWPGAKEILERALTNFKPS